MAEQPQDAAQGGQPFEFSNHPADTEALLASIVSSSDDAIISKTLKGIILSWNQGAERLFGYTASEAIGQPITILIPPERLDEEQYIISRLSAGFRIEHFETERMAKDGRRVHISVTVSPVHNRDGQIVAASKVARDITARKKVESTLAVQLNDVRRLQEMSVQLCTTLELEPILQETLKTAIAIDGADLGLLSLLDTETNILQVGATQGFDPESIRELDSIRPGEGACGVCFAERRRVIVEDAAIDPAMAPFRALISANGIRAVHSTPLITRTGSLLGVLTTLRRTPGRPTDRQMHLIDLCARQAVDFIENSRLYNEVRQAGRRNSEFLAILAHELRNPLAPLSNALDVLHLSGTADENLRGIVDVMDRQVKQLIRLVDDLLDVSRLTRGRIELKREPVEVKTIASRAIESNEGLINQQQHQLIVSIPDETLVVDGDLVRLVQVVSNLLNNAAKYTEPRGRIDLVVRRREDEVEIAVADTGMGIAADDLPGVFGMFAQGARMLSRQHGGLGIGLMLSRSFVELHGGRIEAFSEGEGRGSCFVISLPLLTDGRAPSLPKRAAHALPTRRILVIDDTRAAGHMLGRLLENLGQVVTLADSGAAALAELDQAVPDVIFSDIAMPMMDGYELARRLRQRPELSATALVALTGFGQADDKRRALEAGFDQHLVKPVSLAALRELLSHLPVPPGAQHD